MTEPRLTGGVYLPVASNGLEQVTRGDVIDAFTQGLEKSLVLDLKPYDLGFKVCDALTQSGGVPKLS